MLDYLGFPDSQDDVNKLLKIVDPAAVVMLVMYVGPSGSNLQKGSSLKFPLQRWVGQVRLQIQKVCFFVKAPGRRDLVFCKQHMGFVEMLGWNYVICSSRFFYPFFFETSHMCFETSHMWGGRTMCFVEGLGHEFCRNLLVGQCSL